MNNPFVPTALHVNLQRLIFIRLIVFCCQVLALIYARVVLRLDLQYTAIILIFVALGLLNGFLYLRLSKRRAPGEREFFVHLLLDVLGLSLLLFLAGGATNPFVSYFLVPVTIAAATLSWCYTGLLATLAVLCYSLLLFFYQPLEVLTPAASAVHAHDSITAVSSPLNLHIIGMWFNFLVSAALITWFVVKMASEIRRQEERLSRYREETLRNEQILAVATQAAGTAHELGTPLSTIAVILKDLQLEQHDPALQADIQLLQQQLEICRQSLRQLSLKADFKNLHSETLSLDTFITQLQEQWQLLRPECSCSCSSQSGSSPVIRVDLTLRQALINLFNNAADASPTGITLNALWDNAHYRLQIRDFGEGVSRELQEQLGTQIVTTKKDGMGVGLVLSQATINRLGGSVRLYPMEEGGTLTEVILPLAQTWNAHE